MTLVNSLENNFEQPNTRVAEPFPLCLERPLGAVVSQSGTQFAHLGPNGRENNVEVVLARFQGGRRRRFNWAVFDASRGRWLLDLRFCR